MSIYKSGYLVCISHVSREAYTPDRCQLSAGDHVLSPISNNPYLLSRYLVPSKRFMGLLSVSPQ